MVWAAARKNGGSTKSLLTAVFMFWAASLMWCVDGIASVLEGEGFFDISAEDAVLGVIIIAAGLFVFAAMYARERLLKSKAAKQKAG